MEGRPLQPLRVSLPAQWAARQGTLAPRAPGIPHLAPPGPGCPAATADAPRWPRRAAATPHLGAGKLSSWLSVPWVPWALALALILNLAVYRALMRRRTGGAAGPSMLARSRKLNALWRMSRPQNIPLSMLLVLVGAFGAEGTAWLSMPNVKAQLALCMGLTVTVTASSCVVNDYFDFVGNADTEQSQGSRPLVTGDIAPAEVKGSLKWIYFVLLICICLVETPALRIYVLLNAVLTYIYTKSLKPRGFLWKNGCVSLIISMAIGLGAIAVQQDTAGAFMRGLRSVLPAMVTTFFGIFSREVIMDVSDVEGDRLAGIRTLPVVAGPAAALRAAQLLVLPVLAMQLFTILGSRYGLLAPGSVLAILGGTGGLAALAWRANQGGPSGRQVQHAIELFPLPLAVAVGHTLTI